MASVRPKHVVFLIFCVLISNNNIYQKTSSCVIDGITLPTLVYYTTGMANLKTGNSLFSGVSVTFSRRVHLFVVISYKVNDVYQSYFVMYFNVCSERVIDTESSFFEVILQSGKNCVRKVPFCLIHWQAQTWEVFFQTLF